LFQTATGLFRWPRAAAVPESVAEPVVRRREPPAEPVFTPRPGELAMEMERPPEPRVMAVGDAELDIPAFLRRQSS
jgi:cell division protein FtsZ